MDRALTSLGKLRGKSSKDLSAVAALPKEYPSDPASYELLEDCGRGVSATVHRAVCKSTGEVVAVKKMNLECVSMGLADVIHEAATMKSYHHPNVLPLYTSFVRGQDLWMVTPFMSGGSILHIMKYQHPEGLDEVAIATIMKYVLLGLEYVHKAKGIHRDVKAGNILIDRDGTVRIGDFGVAATIERGGSWGNDKMSRTTFVGTPCWMAPEVMEQTQGYDSSADIWSFGITMLELANGHAPFAKFPPMKVLLMTLQNPPPQLDDKQGRKHFSKQMRNLVARCLQKDPRSRPSATELLQDKFFKQARDEEYLVHTLMTGMPALGERVQQIRVGKAATTAAENDKQLERSQEEYVKGVSSWNFDLAALKAQAAMEPDDGSVPQTPTFPVMPTIMEGPEPVEGDGGSASSSRRSTEDAAAMALLPPPATAAATAGPNQAAALQAGQPQQQQIVQQQREDAVGQPQHSAAVVQQRQQVGSTADQQQQGFGQQQQQPVQHQSVLQVIQHEVAVQQQQQQQQQMEASTVSMPQQQQQHQADSMRRTSSAFAGSPALAAAAAAAGTAAPEPVGSSSNQLQAHFSEPAAVQTLQPTHQQQTISAATTAVNILGGSSGGSSYCLSPLNGSPPMSRESSSQGPLSMLATTPDGLTLRGKSKGRHGRFQVYEHGEEPPPMSPPASRGVHEGLSGSFSRSERGVLVGEPRLSDPAGDAALVISSTKQTPAEAEGLLAAAAAAPAAVAVPAAAAVVPAGPLCNGTIIATPTAAGGTPAVGFASGSEYAAAVAADGIAADVAAGTVSGTSTPPLPPAGPSANLVTAGLVVSGSISEGMDAAGTTEPKKRGRFKIIEEESPAGQSRGGFSKVPSSADLAKSASSRGLAGTATGVLPELQKLHEQAMSHQQTLGILIDRIKIGSSIGNLAAAADDSLPAAPPPAAAGGAAGVASASVGVSRKASATGLLSRSTSSKGLLGGSDLRNLNMQQLLPQFDSNAEDLAERLLERGQELERRLSDLAEENQKLKLKLALAEAGVVDVAAAAAAAGRSGVLTPVSGTAGSGGTMMPRAEQIEKGYMASVSRRVSTANYPSGAGSGSGALPLQQQQGSAAATAAAAGGSSSSSIPNGGLGERYSSGGDSSSSAATVSTGCNVIANSSRVSTSSSNDPAAVAAGPLATSAATGVGTLSRDSVGGSLARDSVASMFWRG